jgi:hypothetical protein
VTDDPEQERYNDYVKERELLVKLEQSTWDSYEKALLTLSSGFLAFSVSFLGLLKGKSGGVVLVCTQLLFYSWVAFATAVIVMVGNFLVEATGMRIAVADVANTVSSKRTYKAKPWTQAALGLNYLAGIIFSTGIFLLIRFCTLNLGIL